MTSGCDSVTAAEGRVVDPAGRPVRGALVVLRREGVEGRGAMGVDSTRTDSAGGFGVILHGGLRTPDAVLTVCGPGYQRRDRDLPDRTWLRDLTVALAPAGPAPVAGGLPPKPPPCP